MQVVDGSRCLIVLGMHRSGTSCLTGTLEQCGVELGEVFTRNPFNQKGNRESADIQALNNDVLAYNGGSWDKPVEAAAWTDAHRRLRTTILDKFASVDSLWWGFKDPRVVFTLPFWLEGIEQHEFIGTIRHPHRVAMSLNHRDRMPFETAYDLWLTYNRQLLKWIEQYSFGVVDFDLDDIGYVEQVSARLAALGLQQEGELFFDPELRHHTALPDKLVLPDEVIEVYFELRRVSHAV